MLNPRCSEPKTHGEKYGDCKYDQRRRLREPILGIPAHADVHPEAPGHERERDVDESQVRDTRGCASLSPRSRRSGLGDSCGCLRDADGRLVHAHGAHGHLEAVDQQPPQISGPHQDVLVVVHGRGIRRFVPAVDLERFNSASCGSYTSRTSSEPFATMQQRTSVAFEMYGWRSRRCDSSTICLTYCAVLLPPRLSFGSLAEDFFIMWMSLNDEDDESCVDSACNPRRGRIGSVL